MLGQTENAEWWNAWGKLKQIVLQLDQAVAKLEASRSYALARPNLRDEYLAKMNDVQGMRSKAIWLRDAIKSAAAAIGMQLSGLGFAPALLLWPVVAAGVAWLGGKSLDLWQFAQRIDEQRRLESTGLSPTAAAALVKSTATAGTLSDTVKTVVPLVVVAGVAWWFFTQRNRG